MSTFLQLLTSGLAVGAVYALVALGFVVIYRASQVFNFAQGEFLAFGAFVMVALKGAGLPWGLQLIGPAWSEDRLLDLAQRVEASA